MQVHILKIYKALRCELDGSRVTVKTKWTLPQTYIFLDQVVLVRAGEAARA